MIARWCISVLIFGLTLFGVVSQQQIAVANQKIVLQFQNPNLTSKQTKNTIAHVKQQLQVLGVTNIQVLSQDNERLKITYHSNIDSKRIKEILSKDRSLTLQHASSHKKDSSSFPFNDIDVSYNLDVYEIQKGHNSGWDFDGAIAIEAELKSDRFLDPNNFYIQNISFQNHDNLIKLAYKICIQITLQISDPLHIIPEVRAGPIC